MSHKPELSLETRLDNAKRQVKRLRDELDIPLHIAREILAKAVYRCSCWKDLKASLTSNLATNPFLRFSTIHPSSGSDDLSFLQDGLKETAHRINQMLLTNRNIAGLHQLVWRVFGFSGKNVCLSDFADQV